MTNHQKISITGATGHLGFCLVQYLLNAGYAVKALYRSTLPNLKHPQLTWIQGNLSNVESLHNLISGTTTTIHCAGAISIGNISDKQVLKVNVDGTKTVIETCEKIDSRLIYISSSNAVKETNDETVFDENRPYKTKSDFPYGWSKALAEQTVLSAVQNKGLNAFIIRPTAIVGPPDVMLSHFGNTILEFATGKFPITTSGGYNIVDLRDLCNTIVNSLEHGDTGEIYLVGGHYKTIREIAAIANPSKKLRQIPIDSLLIILPFILLIKKVFKFNWPISKESLITLNYAPKNVSSAKAVKYLNHTIRPTEETINDLVAWFKTSNKL